MRPTPPAVLAAVALVVGLGAGFVLGLGVAALLQGSATVTGGQAALPTVAPPVPGAVLGRGPHGGVVFALDASHRRLEVQHNEHWGVVDAWLLDADLEADTFEEPPILNVLLDGETYAVEGGPENGHGVRDGGWHFEDAGLMGEVEGARFRIHLGETVFLPDFRHVHLDAEHAAEHAEGPVHAVDAEAEE